MVPIKKRIDLVDALRGFAIFGILLLHSIEHFNYYVFPKNDLQTPFMVALNKDIWDAMFFIFGSKTYGIFAMLFGFTFHLQFSKQLKLNKDFGPRFLWRMLLLFCFGWINSILFPGEILLLYAVLSPSLFFMRKLSDKNILLIAILFLLQPWLIFNQVNLIIDTSYVVPNFKVNELWGQISAYIGEGSLFAMIQNSFIGFKGTFYWSLENGRISQTIGLFAMGLFFGRKNLFNNSSESLIVWRKTLVVSFIAFFPLLILFYKLKGNDEFLHFEKIINAYKNLAQLFVMVSLFILLFKTNAFKKITKPLLAYGRMSLSNYMFQSLIGGLLFYPYGFNLADKVNVTYSLLIGIGLFIVFVLFCNYWIKKHKQGPMENIWHKLTWLKYSK